MVMRFSAGWLGLGLVHVRFEIIVRRYFLDQLTCMHRDEILNRAWGDLYTFTWIAHARNGRRGSMNE